MDNDRFVIESLAPLLRRDLNSTPEAHMTRQAWQEQVERLIERMREAYRRPAFGLTEAEISVHYHRPLGDFLALIESRLT